MESKKEIITEDLSFQEIRNRNGFYIDKTMLIADILDRDDSGVYLFTRPHHFGKSINISMLDTFFNMEYKDNRWFDDLEISKHHEYDSYRNAFPTIYIDMKDTVATDFNDFVSKMRGILKNTFSRFDYLLNSDALRKDEISEIESVLNKTANKGDLEFCVLDLCIMLEKHHNRKPIVLIDEYDRPLTSILDENQLMYVVDFLATFMSTTLKSNHSLEMAYVTGSVEVIKSGIFSRANNLFSIDVLSQISDKRFGFTEEEVLSILEYYDHPEKMDEVKEWYGGYHFGDAELYNPYSVMNYVADGFKAQPYWVKSENDAPVKWMMEKGPFRNIGMVANIISGLPAEVSLNNCITYENLHLASDSELYALMVKTGYLKAVPRDEGMYAISIPNREVMGMVEDVLKSIVPVDDSVFRDFAAAVMDGNTGKMETILGGLLEGASYFDLKDESDYKLAVFLCLHGIIWRYNVEYEKRKGNGRLYIIMIPKTYGLKPIIMELKVSDSDSALESDATDAIGQIHDRRYYNRMTGEVLLYGIAFHGVVPKVVTERIVL